jgi:hypothetical protein
VARTLPETAFKTSSDYMSGALWNAGPKALGDFLLGPPVFRGTQFTPQSVPNATWTAMALDAASIDTDGGHSNVTNNSRYNCQVPGWYWAEGYVALSPVGGQSRYEAAIAKNGVIWAGSAQFTSKANADYQALVAGAMVQLAVGDYVEAWGRQQTLGAVATWTGGDLCPCLNVLWLHS